MIVMLLNNAQNVQTDTTQFKEYVKLAQRLIIALNVQTLSRAALYVMRITLFQMVHVKNVLLYYIAQLARIQDLVLNVLLDIIQFKAQIRI